jgi:hypothetical protein
MAYDKKVSRYIYIYSIGLAIFALSFCSIEYLPNAIFEDDAYFYFQIAKNILDLGQSTFDGISTTNGYHPLWMAVLVAAGAPLKLAGVQSLSIYAGFFIAVSCLVWVFILFQLEGWAVLLGAILALYCGLGMEAPLAAMFLILIFDRMLNDKPAAIWVYLLVATRVDMAIVLLPILFFSKVKDKGYIVLAALLAEGTVAIFNLILTGHPYSISGLIKSGMMATGLLAIAAENFSSAGNLYRYLVVAVVNIGLFYFMRTNTNLRPNNQRLWLALIITANTFLLAHTFMSYTRHWYFAPTLLPLLYLWSRLNLEHLNSQSAYKIKTYSSASMASLVGLGSVLFIAYIVQNLNDMRASKKFFEDMLKIVPAGNVIYALDGAGYPAWMLNGHAQVIDGDGLVNSFEYFNKTLRNCDMQSYFKKNNVKYYLVNSTGRDNCPISCYCLNAGEYNQVLASTSQRKYTSYRLYAMSPK